MAPNKKQDKKSKRCNDDSSSSSSSSEVVITVEKHKKGHKGHYSESESSSSSSSSSSSESRHKKHHKKPHKRHETSDSSSSSSDDVVIKVEKHKKHHKKSDSDSSCSKKSKPEVCDFDELYNYYKYKLLHDDSLMIGGSGAYINSIETEISIIPRGWPVEITTNTVQKNIDHFYPGAPFFAREDGIYILFFIATDDNTSQWTIFVNGNVQQYTTVGTNSGAGQVINRTMLSLKKDDGVIVRNYTSNSVSVTTAHKAGGKNECNDLTLLLMKIAPLNPALPREMTCEDNKCLDKKLYRKLLSRLLCDKDLMMQGFNIHGSFYTTLSQSLVAEQDVSLLDGYLANGIVWNPTSVNPEQIKITEDGVYKLFFVLNNNVPCQFCFCVNGVPVDTTIQGTNKGADQLTIRTILELKANDIVTVRNHTSNSPTVTTNENAGGVQASVSVVLTIFKIAPLASVPIVIDECKISEHYKCCYGTFKNYLLKNEHLQITGSPAYVSLHTKDHQEISINESVHWSYYSLKYNIDFTQGYEFFTIEKEGVYDLFGDIMTNEPGQFTLFINGVPFYATTSGRESGANRCIMRQFVKFSKGDVISIRNWESNAGTLNTAVNPGGTEPGNSALFMLFRLSASNTIIHPCPPIEPPCPPCPPCPPKPPCPPVEPPCPPKEDKSECKSESSSEHKHKHRKHGKHGKHGKDHKDRKHCEEVKKVKNL
jgi:hypothetical protein